MRTDRDGVPAGRDAHRIPGTVLAAMMAALALPGLDFTAVATALPTALGELGAPERLGWVGAAHLAGMTVGSLVAGKASDLFDRRACYHVALAVFALGALVSGAAQGFGQILGGRVVLGLASGGVMALSQTIMAALVSPRSRGRYQRYIAIVFALTGLVGPPLGGLFSEHATWRMAYWVLVPAALLAVLASRRLLRPLPPVVTARWDWAGTLLLLGIATSFAALTISTGDGGGTAVAGVLGLAGLALVLLTLFVYVERRVSEGLLPVPAFDDPLLRVVLVLSLLTGAQMYTAVLFLPAFLQSGLGMSAGSAGAAMLPMMAGMVTGSWTSGTLVSRWGRYRALCLLGGVLTSLGFSALTLAAAVTAGPAAVGAMGLVGMGLGVLFQCSTIASQNAVAIRHLGAVTAANHFVRYLGGMGAIAVFGWLAGGGGQRASYVGGFAVLAVLAVASLVASLVLRDRPLGTSVPSAAPPPR